MATKKDETNQGEEIQIVEEDIESIEMLNGSEIEDSLKEAKTKFKMSR